MEIERLTLEEIIELIDHCLLEGTEPERALRIIRRRVADLLIESMRSTTGVAEAWMPLDKEPSPVSTEGLYDEARQADPWPDDGDHIDG